MSRHFKGGGEGWRNNHSVTSKPLFSKVNAALELINNPWLSAILTGIVCAMLHIMTSFPENEEVI